jgi:hypothetical protein
MSRIVVILLRVLQVTASIANLTLVGLGKSPFTNTISHNVLGRCPRIEDADHDQLTANSHQLVHTALFTRLTFSIQLSRICAVLLNSVRPLFGAKSKVRAMGSAVIYPPCY